MSEQRDDGPGEGATPAPDEPIDCDVCGSPLEFKIGAITSNETEWAETGTALRAEVLQRCTNVDCPSRGDSGMAKGVGPDGSQG